MRAGVTVLGISRGRGDRRATRPGRGQRRRGRRDIAGIIVADPDPADHTTGRLPQPARLARTTAASPLYRHNDGDPTVKDKDRQVLPSLNGDADLPERLWLYDDFSPGRGPAGHRFRHRVWPAWDSSAPPCGAPRRCCVPPGDRGIGLRCRLRRDVAAVISGVDDGPAHARPERKPGRRDADRRGTCRTATSVAQRRRCSKLGLNESVSTFLAAVTVTPITDRRASA